jgi:hypothetical protein
MIIAGSAHGNLMMYLPVDHPQPWQMNLPHVENNS